MQPKVTQPSLLVIRSADVAASVAFYRTLGLDFVEEQHGAGPLHFACDLGGFVFEIYPLKSGQSATNDSAMLGFRVDSIDASLAALKSLGVEPKAPPRTAEWGRFANVTDGDGRTVQLTEAV